MCLVTRPLRDWAAWPLRGSGFDFFGVYVWGRGGRNRKFAFCVWRSFNTKQPCFGDPDSMPLIACERPFSLVSIVSQEKLLPDAVLLGYAQVFRRPKTRKKSSPPLLKTDTKSGEQFCAIDNAPGAKPINHSNSESANFPVRPSGNRRFSAFSLWNA